MMSSNILVYKYKKRIGIGRQKTKSLQTRTKNLINEKSNSCSRWFRPFDVCTHMALNNIIDARSDTIMLLAVGIFNNKSPPLEYYAATRELTTKGLGGGG